jgi:glycosyltransferase involved in cell wall biosynthesis
MRKILGEFAIMHFKIIIPMYNVDRWVETNIRSVLAQTHEDYQVIIIDDISTDNSFEKVQNLISNDDRFVLVKNKQKRYALENIVRAIQMSNPEEEDVIVTLDGDDWLPNSGVLEKISQIYENTGCYITYGTYSTYPGGNKPWNVTAYPEEIVRKSDYRKDIWRASHLRTFKFFLWDKIKDEDLRDTAGNYYKMAWDLAFMFPMLEMSNGKYHYVQDTTYIYNRVNPINDDKVNHALQLSLDKEIRQKSSYLPVEKK